MSLPDRRLQQHRRSPVPHHFRRRLPRFRRIRSADHQHHHLLIPRQILIPDFPEPHQFTVDWTGLLRLQHPITDP